MIRNYLSDRANWNEYDDLANPSICHEPRMQLIAAATMLGVSRRDCDYPANALLLRGCQCCLWWLGPVRESALGLSGDAGLPNVTASTTSLEDSQQVADPDALLVRR